MILRIIINDNTSSYISCARGNKYCWPEKRQKKFIPIKYRSKFRIWKWVIDRSYSVLRRVSAIFQAYNGGKKIYPCIKFLQFMSWKKYARNSFPPQIQVQTLSLRVKNITYITFFYIWVLTHSNWADGRNKWKKIKVHLLYIPLLSTEWY